VVTVREATAEARRAAIRDAAVRAFVRSGVAGVTMQQIAAEAGLTAGALYRYFPNKETLLREVIAGWLAEDRSIAEQSAGGGSAVEQLLRFVRMLAVPLGTPETRRKTLMALETELAAARWPEAIGGDHRAMRQSELRFTERLVRNAQSVGEIDPAIDARSLAALINAIGFGMYWMTLQLEDEVSPLPVVALLERILHAFAVPAPSAPNGA
jgi:TetR/AcrR family transcriptional regulator, repressor for uid operon